ncbi:MAG TPA: TlpA disulfide reductase family protein [Capsulimonadaceae bacterium]|jgi:thiol-disulfide isomerase/thioredoxin
MYQARTLVATAVLALTALTPCGAALKPAKPVVVKPQAVAPKASPAKVPEPADTSVAAKAALARLSHLITDAKCVQYTSKVKFLVPSPDRASASKFEYGIDAQVQMPDRYRINIARAGVPYLVFATGADTGTVAELTKGKYASFEPADSPTGFLVGVSKAGAGLLPEDADTAFWTFDAVTDAHPFDITGILPPGYTLSLTDASYNGKPVKKLVQAASRQGVTLAYKMLLDPSTGLPVHVEKTLTGQGRTMTPIQEDFSAWHLSSTAVPDSEFAVSLTPAMTPYTAPAAPGMPVPLAKGTAAPDFEALDVAGKPVKLSSFAGKPVVIDFWATWCGPCQRSLPLSNKLAAEYASKGVTFLGVCSWDAKDKFAGWLKDRKSWTMQFVFDPAAEDQPKSIAVTQYGVSGIPTQFVLGKDGKVVGYMDYADPSDRHLRKLIDKALAQ